MKALIFTKPYFLLVSLILFSCSGSDDDSNNPDSCSDAILITIDTASDFSSATSENYTTLCDAYKESLEDQKDLCGDDDGSIQNIIDSLGNCEPLANTSCEELFLSVVGSGFSCNNSLYGDLQINNIYIIEEYPTDEDGDGINDHFFSTLLITDGTAVLDNNNSFVSFSNDRTYVFEIGIKSIGTSGFVPANYIPFIFVNPSTDSFLNLSLSQMTINNCVSDLYLCEDRFGALDGAVQISGSPSNYSLCFNFIVDFDDNCFGGDFQGDFIEMNTD